MNMYMVLDSCNCVYIYIYIYYVPLGGHGDDRRALGEDHQGGRGRGEGVQGAIQTVLTIIINVNDNSTLSNNDIVYIIP